jgi:plastocyanin
MKLRKRYLPLVAVLGAATAVLPAIASSTSPTVNAIEEAGGYHYVAWSPSQASVKPAGTVIFQDMAGQGEHGVIWDTASGNPETPKCEGVPIGVGKENWSGTCTFSKVGVYEFECAVHRRKMVGWIYVNAEGTTTTTTQPTTTTTTTPPPTTTTTTTPPPTTTATTPTATIAGTPSPGGTTATPPPATAEEQAGGPHDSLRGAAVSLAASQRGTSVHGSIRIAQAGSRLEVDLLAPNASLAGIARSRTAVVGRLVKPRVSAGRVSFQVALTARARHALARRGRLALTIRIVLTPPHGAGLTRTMVVTLHR